VKITTVADLIDKPSALSAASPERRATFDGLVSAVSVW
jgi:hypothetical protein